MQKKAVTVKRSSVSFGGFAAIMAGSLQFSLGMGALGGCSKKYSLPSFSGDQKLFPGEDTDDHCHTGRASAGKAP